MKTKPLFWALYARSAGLQSARPGTGRWRQRSALCSRVAGLVLLALPLYADVPALVFPGEGGGGVEYNPDTQRVAWWGGLGTCGGENPSPASVSFASAKFLVLKNQRTGMSCDGLIEGLTSDEAYLSFSQGGWLWELALGSFLNQAPFQLPLGVTSGYTPEAVARIGDQLLWVESDGSFSKLWQADSAGHGQQSLLLTGFWGPVHKLRVFYGFGFGQGRFCCFLSDDGRLWRAQLDPPTGPSLVASGVKDFDFRWEYPALPLVPHVALYLAEGTQLETRVFGAGSGTVIYTAGAGHSVDAVTVDSQRVYFIDTFEGNCAPLICYAYSLWRQDRPDDFSSGPGQWVNFSAPVQNVIKARSFHAAGNILVWSDTAGLRSISADAPPVFLNFLAVGLEAVQTVQNLNNQVTLVGGKPTYVRAYARTDFNTTGSSKFLPSGILRVSGLFPPLPPVFLGTLNPVQPGYVDGTSDLAVLRGDLKRSYLFELPPAWTKSYIGLRCEFEVNPDKAYIENVGFDPYGDNTVSQDVAFVQGGQQCWVFVTVANCAFSVPYVAQDKTSDPDFWRIIDRAVSLLPIERSKVQVHTWPDWIHSLPRSVTAPTCFNLNNSGDWANVRAMMVFWSIGRTHPCACERFIGTVDPSMVSGTTTGIGGTCPLFANSSAVEMDAACRAPWNCPNGGVTLAHELSHNFCRSHVLCSGTEADPDPSYPYPQCTITIANLSDPAADFGFDPLSLRVVNPGMNADLMSYGSRTWTSDYTWNALLAYGNGPCFPGHGAAESIGGMLKDDQLLLVLTGTIDTQSQRIELFPAYSLPPGVLDPNLFAGSGTDTNSAYSVRLADSHGNTLTNAPLTLQPTDSHDPTPVNMIAQTLALPAGAQTLQILHAGQVLLERYFSPHVPIVALAAPQVNLVTRTLNCAWTADDADGDPLLFTVQYSADDGASWFPLETASAATEHHVDLASLPGSAQARVRVVATDGLNCAMATSDPFVVPNNPPIAVILGLRAGDRLPFGTQQPISGVIHDTEDGQPDPALQQWTLSGPVFSQSSGERVSLSSLPPGTYTLTLTGSDSAGQMASNTVPFEILPLPVPDRPSPVVDGLAADEAYVDALEVPFNFGWAQPAYARLSHGDGALHVAFTGLPFSTFSNSPLSIGLVVDTDWSRDATIQTNDVGFFVDETGVPSQWQGDGAAMILNHQPSRGVQTAVFRGSNVWSAELAIPDTLLGGWGHPAGLVIHLRDLNNVIVHTWPESASTASPQTWAPALFGVAPPASNGPPVAVARVRRVQTISTSQPIVLDGTGSYDPDGLPLTYHWTQLAGPAVSLSDAASASPSFAWPPGSGQAEFQFRLVVNNGQTDSQNADIDFTVYSVALNPQPLPPVQIDAVSGAVSGALTWPGTMGDLAVIEASQDLRVWTPIATNSVDFDGRLHFHDPETNRYPYRFYRGRE